MSVCSFVFNPGVHCSVTQSLSPEKKPSSYTNMMTGDDSGEEETILEPRVEVETASFEKSKPGDLLDLMSRFLESPGNVLLIQGAPGTGKTTIALELLNR